MKTGLREIAQIHQGDFRLTANQNLVIGGVEPGDRTGIDELVEQYGLARHQRPGGVGRNAMSCVALPTCGLALAESERYLPALVEKLQTLMAESGLSDEDMVVRVTGCPNGCARPYLAEIGLVGKGPGKYNLYLGAAFDGSRLNRLYRAALPEAQVVPVLRPLIQQFAQERQEAEHFGDFCFRTGIIESIPPGENYHEPMVTG